MVGIKSFGAYVPWLRLDRAAIARAWGIPGAPGAVAVANFDEDSLTMAWEAASDCLAGLDGLEPGGLFFASTTPPYAEKSAATLIATVLDLPGDALTSDYAVSLRASTSALSAALDAVKAGRADDILVTAADTRASDPMTAWEQTLGDGAGAALVGSGDGVIAEHLGSYSAPDEIYMTWRRQSRDRALKEFNARMAQTEGYGKSMVEGIRSAMGKLGVKAEDIARAVYSAPDFRSHGAVAKALGFDPATQVQDALFAFVGGTGTAQPLLMLAGALESGLKAGDLVLLAHYGDGVDVSFFRVTEAADKLPPRRGLRGYLSSRTPLQSYPVFLRYREALEMRRPEYSSSTVILWRERRELYALYGSRCRACGLVRFPPQIVCSRCRTRGEGEEVRLARRGRLFNFINDRLFESMESPTTLCLVDLEGGGRVFLHMTDRDPEAVELDMEVELTFRKLFEGEDFYTYFWKCRPVREGGDGG
ncbi:MAG: hydroxymethylglutaryl-CoA synthase family protein [Actinobacteria bacterium]|nr:hydroxymethylglutaryl-CoA synthase family protein [Actinomycetota bacterium]